VLNLVRHHEDNAHEPDFVQWKSMKDDPQKEDGGEVQGIHEGAKVDAASICKSLGLPVQRPLPCHWHKVA
jgi:hypothetical protein